MVERRKRAAPPAKEAPTRRKRRAVVGAAEEVADEFVAPTYFASVSAKEAAGLQFFSTGCAKFDADLGGGWVLGRVSNLVGDKSSGKTLLAIEAAANFARKFPDGWIRYAEAESAFDQAYAEEMGMPEGRVEYNGDGTPMETVSQWERDLKQCLDKGKGRPGLYILDSLDAVEADEEELGKEITEAGFGGKKPKMIGALFRKYISQLEEQNVHLMIVSQLRDKIGVTFGETKTRSGGKALDFYATHIVWVAVIKTLKQIRDTIERPIGVQVKAKVKKNKVGLPLREAEYPILYGYGIDDLTANIEWLLEVGRDELLREKLGISKSGYKMKIANMRNRGGPEVAEMRETLRQMVFEVWTQVETTFLPKSRKY